MYAYEGCERLIHLHGNFLNRSSKALELLEVDVILKAFEKRRFRSQIIT